MGIAVGAKPCCCPHETHHTQLIAVTGGPGAGKTAILEMAMRSFCDHVGVLPESASIIFGGGFPRLTSDEGRRAAQRAIYYTQRELERIALQEQLIAVALCDRGTLDGAAYWPGDTDEYWRELETSLEAELSRYKAVIHLRTPAAHEGYDNSNVLRIESALEAQRIDEKILDIWSGHPNRLVVSSAADFLHKASEALALIEGLLPGCCRAQAAAG